MIGSSERTKQGAGWVPYLELRLALLTRDLRRPLMQRLSLHAREVRVDRPVASRVLSARPPLAIFQSSKDPVVVRLTNALSLPSPVVSYAVLSFIPSPVVSTRILTQHKTSINSRRGRAQKWSVLGGQRPDLRMEMVGTPGAD